MYLTRPGLDGHNTDTPRFLSRLPSSHEHKFPDPKWEMAPRQQQQTLFSAVVSVVFYFILFYYEKRFFFTFCPASASVHTFQSKHFTTVRRYTWGPSVVCQVVSAGIHSGKHFTKFRVVSWNDIDSFFVRPLGIYMSIVVVNNNINNNLARKSSREISNLSGGWGLSQMASVRQRMDTNILTL